MKSGFIFVNFDQLPFFGYVRRASFKNQPKNQMLASAELRELDARKVLPEFGAVR